MSAAGFVKKRWNRDSLHHSVRPHQLRRERRRNELSRSSDGRMAYRNYARPEQATDGLEAMVAPEESPHDPAMVEGRPA